MGFEILKAEMSSEHGSKTLRLYLDKPEGIQIADCEKFSHALGPILDVEGEIQGRYDLEISSPGLDRPLSKLEHFAAQAGKIVQVSTGEPLEGRRHFKGELLRTEEGDAPALEMAIDGKIFRIELSQIKKANLDFFASEARSSKASPSGKKKHRSPLS